MYTGAVNRIRLFFSYTVCNSTSGPGETMGEMKRAIAWENEQRTRYASTVVIAAAIIAAVRLARDDISAPSPRIMNAIADSVGLARMILRRVVGQ